MVEYLHGVQGVAGSIPVTPTTKLKSALCRFLFCDCATIGIGALALLYNAWFDND